MARPSLPPRRIVRRPPGPPPAAPVGDVHPVLARLYQARTVLSAQELDYGLARLQRPERLKGMGGAVDLLVEAIERRWRLWVVADFDADGATSCALAVRALRALGVAEVGHLVPNRFEYGYGLTPEIVALAARARPDLLITVDNGISSGAGVRAAQAAGMRVLITDHHLPGAEMPPAEAIVDPNQPGDDFPSKHLAGVGVIFYVLLALRARLREGGAFRDRPEPNLAGLLDLVALGTVADVAPLDHNNRILVAQGLRRINAGQACPGIRALLAVSGRRAGDVTAADLAFGLAPRLNAAGRLADMSLGVACLLSEDEARARAMAGRLDALNRERREIEAGMQAQALDILAALDPGGDLPRGLCLYDETWHQGVIGLVASRLKDRLHRPVIAFAPAGDGELKGSARSVPGVHIRDVLDACAARHPRLLSRFGGHALAAGLSLERRHYEAFRLAFAEEVARCLPEEGLEGLLWSDGELRAADLDLGLAERLRAGGPWGQGFPEPLFDGCFEVVTSRIVGERHLRLSLRHPEGRVVEAIAFGVERTLAPSAQVEIAYRLDVNDYNGERRLQLVVEQLGLA